MFKSWRRKRVLANESIPDSLWRAALAASPALGRLSDTDLARLRELALLFLHEKRFEPARGFTVTDEMRVRVAVLGSVPILNLGLDSYATRGVGGRADLVALDRTTHEVIGVWLGGEHAYARP